MSLAPSCMKRNLSAPAKTEPERRDHDRSLAKLDGLRHSLKAADHQIDLVPFLILDCDEKLHDIGARRKIRCVPCDDKAVKVRHCSTARPQFLLQKRDDISSDRIHLGVKLEATDTIPDIDQ